MARDELDRLAKELQRKLRGALADVTRTGNYLQTVIDTIEQALRDGSLHALYDVSDGIESLVPRLEKLANELRDTTFKAVNVDLRQMIRELESE